MERILWDSGLRLKTTGFGSMTSKSRDSKQFTNHRMSLSTSGLVCVFMGTFWGYADDNAGRS
jgi:hypothetical protein